MITDQQLLELPRRVGAHLLSARHRLVTAESCTGGWIAKAMTDVPGSSQWFDCGYVTYSNTAKSRDLGVSAKTLVDYGAVSEEVVREMTLGALKVSGVEVAVSVSGVAGPDGGTASKPVGLVWFCVGVLNASGEPQLAASVQRFNGDRDAIRRAAVEYVLDQLLQLQLPMKS